MIENTNSTLGLTDEEFQEYAVGFKDLNSVNAVIQNLEKRRENAINGGANCIPLPFKNFRTEIPGIEQGQYVIVTANQKVGKTNIANFVYLFHTLDYAYNNPDKCSVHIIYFALEETISKIIERYMSYLLFQIDGIRISPTDLRSTSSDCPIPKDIIDKLSSDEYQKRLKFFEECVQFDTENTNPTGVLRVCEEYAKSVGKYTSHTIKSKGVLEKDVSVFDSYVQNDVNHYKILMIDHVSLLDKENGYRTKDSVDKMSEYCVKYLRNRYNYTCVIIQQQASDAEGLDAIKQKKMIPTAATLSDSKYTGRDADLVLGLFDPSKFGLPQWLGYKIQDESGMGLKTYGRFMYVIANRNGEMGGICPLFFDGAVCNFEELPKPDDINAVSKYYARIQNLKSFRQQQKVKNLILFLYRKFTNERNYFTNRKKKSPEL